MLLARLALLCVILLGFGPCSAGYGLKMDSTFCGGEISQTIRGTFGSEYATEYATDIVTFF
jgi:hypothetical protein